MWKVQDLWEECRYMEIELTKYERIDMSLRDRWLSLWRNNSSAHPFNHPAWFQVAPSRSKDSSKVVVVASRNSRDLMFLAGEAHKKKLSLLGSPYLEKSSVLVSETMSREDWKEVIESLLIDYHQIAFQEIPEGLAKVMHIETNGAWLFSRRASFSPLFEVENPLLSGKRRHELRRYTRKLDREHGPLTIDFVPLKVELLHVMAGIEKRSTKPAKGRAELENKIYLEFIKNVINQYQGMCWIGLMYLSGDPVAHYAGIAYNTNLIGLHMAFDERFRRYSPGSVLIFNLLPILAKRRIGVFEFGRGESVVKSRFSGSRVNRQDTLYFFKRNARGSIGMINNIVLWKGISLGRLVRARNIRSLNQVLDRLTIKR